MTDWKIFQGNTTPHDDIDNLPSPPNWRKFGYSVGEKEFEFVNVDLQSSSSLETQERGSKFQISSNQPELVDLINAALYLRRPLLITGKPGTGKTSLAYAVAYELKLGSVLLWAINTRSTLQEGLYRYDAISRLQDAQIKVNKNPQQNSQNLQNKNDYQDIGYYIQLGPVGTALLPSKRPRVLLIDEVDKSDINLPNDLLNLFEEGKYEIPELTRLSKQIDKAEVRTDDGGNAVIKSGIVRCYEFPFIVLTSNGERDFPPAFLRRCLRINIKDPNETALTEIVKSHLGDEVLEKAKPLIEQFINKRNQGKGDLATDQLLNAVYLINQKLNFDETNKDNLIELLLKSLTSAE
ncbi:AAA family ATPase [Nostoc sp. KVJ3]|uniref:AAA family ATPase n=1 Tax=Nostoc sp. KVJ3 TaxID=457945 RepID=UPI00223808C7|nr:MoxR family ATPase [Nostoc sp. KVJ3]MCW5319159.1 AAA family ATPase [Nostoc sp. KVJ3]